MNIVQELEARGAFDIKTGQSGGYATIEFILGGEHHRHAIAPGISWLDAMDGVFGHA